LLGRNAIRDDDVDLSTVNGYAYYRYSRSAMLRLGQPAEGLRLAVHAEPDVDRWRDDALPRYRATVARWAERPVEDLSGAELLDGVVELLDAGTEYYTAVQTIIPIAVTSEVVFTQLYERLVRRPGDPAAATYLLGSDSLPIAAEKSLFDVASWTRSQPELADVLVHDDDPDPAAPEWHEWLDRLQEHLDQYGHTVYNLDFVNPVPADDPGPLVDTVRFYLREPDRDPYARQRATVQRREQATDEVLGRLDPVRKKVVLRALRWAQRIAPVREDALADVGLAWPQMRWMLAEAGDRVAGAGIIEQPDDLYWLRRDELATALAATENRGERPRGLPEAVEQRKQEWRGRRRVTPPPAAARATVVPDARQHDAGDDERAGRRCADRHRGERGRVTATARVLGGPADFSRLEPGDVLVASITTPAWTTLFARAAAVVTDIGGPLSHSSIVAREYGIPAVLGTGVATRRIHQWADHHRGPRPGRVIPPSRRTATVRRPPRPAADRGGWGAVGRGRGGDGRSRRAGPPAAAPPLSGVRAEPVETVDELSAPEESAHALDDRVGHPDRLRVAAFPALDPQPGDEADHADRAVDDVHQGRRVELRVEQQRYADQVHGDPHQPELDPAAGHPVGGQDRAGQDPRVGQRAPGAQCLEDEVEDRGQHHGSDQQLEPPLTSPPSAGVRRLPRRLGSA
jgi:pyruvate,water dikinase